MIRILDEITINQIAAGEVIEMAASVVKELIENSIDAGANFIRIETKAGGRQLISISDNGIGMDEDDLLLSIERHATSKIKTIDDLFQLKTLGFRGEALSSIASISKMTLHSAGKKNVGHKLFLDGGKVLKKEMLPRKQGTTIEVTSLFYNVPARKKFQKSVAFDTSEIHKVLVQAVLCNPTVSFEWVHDDKLEFRVIEGSLLDRIEGVLGKEFSENLLEIDSGFIGKASFHKPNRLGQYLFINQRGVTSPFVSKVVLEMYGERLPPNRYPIFVLHLTCDPKTIDVNVHPRKLEVRLGCEEEIKKEIHTQVKKALEREFEPTLAPFQTLPPPPCISIPPMPMTVEISKPLPQPLQDNITLLFNFDGYLFVKREDEFLVVDETRARSRVFFDALFERKTPLNVQHLLLPLTLKKTAFESEVIETHLPFLNRIGIAIRPFGKETFCIEAIPEHLSEKEVEELIDVLEPELPEKKIISKFCSRFRRRILNQEEALYLVRTLFRSQENPFTPDGKPIFFRITPKEIAKWLG